MFELVFDNMIKPINVGVIIRLACSAGCRVYFTGNSVDYKNRKALLAAVGYEEQVDIVYEADFEGLISALKSEGKQIIGTSPRAEVIYSDMRYDKPTVFVFGNEAKGLSAKKIDMMDKLITIPMPGQIESLNVVNSAAIILYEGLRQRGFVNK
ncbi:MAG: RNA methyltransferase [Bacillota bacterium]|nr:RNA methyltransferase [Bacillota bacterium]